MSDSLLNLMPRIAMATYIIGWRDETPITSNEFLNRVSNWRALLVQLPGKNYALYLEDSIEFAAALFGAWHADKTIWLAADTLLPTTAALKHSVDGFLGEFPADCSPLKPSGKTDSKVDYTPLDSQFIGLVVHTSGTTGAPQAIFKKLSQLASEVATLEQLFGQQCAHADVISTVTHQHIYGLLFSVLWPLAFQRAMHAHTLFFPEELANAVSTRSCVLISSPAHLKRLPTQLNWPDKDNAVRAIFSSGGVLPSAVAEATLNLLGQSPIEIFGSSETGGIAWRCRSVGSDENWLLMPNVELRIADGEGLIEVRSPHLFREEWLPLSDRALVKTNGRFILQGRCDRIVKIEEKRISLESIEQRIATSPLVSEVGIIAFDERMKKSQRQYLAAVVVLTEAGKSVLQNEGKLALNRQIKNGLVNCVEPVAIPRRWRYVENFPLNAQGKTPETMLRDLFTNKHEGSNSHFKTELSITVVPERFYRGSSVAQQIVEKSQAVESHWTPDKSARGRRIFENLDSQMRIAEHEGAPLNRENKSHSPISKLLHHDAHSAEFELIWPSNLLYFEGHFPQTPILPGVVQVDWAIKTGRQFFSLPTQFGAMRALKFQHVILPDSTVNLKLNYDPQKVCLSFSYFSKNKQHASGRIHFVSHFEVAPC